MKFFEEHEEPKWAFKGSREIWREDDAGVPDRERIRDAWKRLFGGEELPTAEEAVEVADLGDCYVRLFRGGRVACYSCEGESIRVIDASISNNEVDENPIGDDAYSNAEDELNPGAGAGAGEGAGGELALSRDQVEAIEALVRALEDGQRHVLLKGPAGTGKTTIVQHIAQAMADRGYAIQYMAPTGKAAARLSEVTRQPASTVHSKLFRTVSVDRKGNPHFKDPKQLGEGKVVYFLDEGSMVGKRLFQQILDNLHPAAKLVVAGDHAQLPPVADTWGPDFDNPTAELTTVHRQGTGDPILDIVTEVRKGVPLPKEDVEGKDGKYYRRRSGTKKSAALWLTEHLSNDEDAAVLCYSNKSRIAINKLARVQLGFDDSKIVAGEQMIVKTNNRFLGRSNGEIFRVNRVENYRGLAGACLLHTDNGVILTAPDLIGEDKKKFLKRKKLLGSKIDERLWCRVDYAYALTVHTSQGSEYDHVCFVIDGTFRWMIQTGRMSYEDACRLCYTALTRAKRTALVLDTR